MDLPKPLQPGLPLSGDEYVRVRQGSGWVYPKLSDIIALATGPLAKALAAMNAAVNALAGRADTLDGEAAAASAAISAANDTAAALAKRVATLEARPSVLMMSGSLPLSTLQVGSTDVQVAVAGLLRADRIVSVVPGASVPTGLSLGYARPLPSADSILLLQTTAGVSLSGKAALPLAVTVLR